MFPVALIFLGSCGVTIALTRRRPHPYLRLRERGIRVESYFLGALLGPLLILAASLGVLARQLGTPIIRTRVADARTRA
ncbi:MAG TPA: hypothetical protein PKG50_05855 [Candidatus Bipolaricaulis anaerobius]|jgi:uncharacterized membrane protein SpoIIM required for sporulation|uniref:Uncharacterized protein n=1 Tax=Candidatus Bipolaricaulis anaerobius TaxID=2026885 RepID=A0A2X3K5M7_9BACT|nr:hypothetical protein [Candidatus Bipolaricaulis anaerobius]MBP7726253.1 hypothetical protein [Candidatus Bipolaricaulis sp.]MDD3747824.1 hypothetical protein [Candidatus Bipolaricaulis anaerobius]MDD5764463.1 hypothetical protein [Candidatus Bipolaricaulis anaerobius]SQD92313.1 protein of unknown function [Candidatus Bipolaricaulis anaerobius]HNR24926.1 hypothetical protein [Candidatus Bipolaricaulis anaerobius]